MVPTSHTKPLLSTPHFTLIFVTFFCTATSVPKCLFNLLIKSIYIYIINLIILGLIKSVLCVNLHQFLIYFSCGICIIMDQKQYYMYIIAVVTFEFKLKAIFNYCIITLILHYISQMPLTLLNPKIIAHILCCSCERNLPNSNHASTKIR